MRAHVSRRRCEAQRAEAIQPVSAATSLDCFASLAMTVKQWLLFETLNQNTPERRGCIASQARAKGVTALRAAARLNPAG
jgi:hypothetical protein